MSICRYAPVCNRLVICLVCTPTLAVSWEQLQPYRISCLANGPIHGQTHLIIHIWGNIRMENNYHKSLVDLHKCPPQNLCLWPSFHRFKCCKQCVCQAFANYTELPIIQMVMFPVLGFYGCDKKEQAANLPSLAGIQSPLIKSLRGL